jgi:mannose-6-phosphate isomerase-like protein (cupin superfamily)
MSLGDHVDQDPQMTKGVAMSYPDARYRGDDGEVSATYRPADQEPDVAIGSAVALSYLATGASTEGHFGLYRWEARSQSAGAAPHFHKTMSESFFVVSGTVQLFNGEEWIDATAGDFVYVPEGGVHGFRNDSDESAAMLILFVPGAPREAYFEAIAERAAGRHFSDGEWDELCRRHDNYFV